MKVDLAAIIVGWDKALATAGHLLDRSAEHAAANGIDEKDLLDWRLAPDMFPLRQQFQILCNLSRKWAARSADLEFPADAEGEASIADLRELVSSTRGFIEGISRERFDGRDDVPVTVSLGPIEPTMPIGQWVTGFANTNILFHLSIAYAILRSRGVTLGKADLFAGGL